ncbi:MAG: MBL fold metallo-hydrolase [Acidimicrobiales bacterium]
MTAGPNPVPAGGAGQPFFLTVLGTDGSYPAPGGACSGYLLRANGFCTLLDAGPGALANLQLHLPLDRLDAVVISHGHSDHWSDLEGLYVAMRYFFQRRGLPVYAPEGLRELMAGEKPDGTFDWHVTSDGQSTELGPVRWTWSCTDHPVETLAARAEVDGRWLAYSADTGPGWCLSELGEGPSLALVEASLATEAEGTVQHLSARQAGGMAAEAGAERLLLTHFTPPIDRERARGEAASAFGDEVEVATVGQTWRI